MDLREFLLLTETTASELKTEAFKAIDILSRTSIKDFKIEPSSVRDLKDFINKYDSGMPPYIHRQITILIRLAISFSKKIDPSFKIKDEAYGIINYINDYRELANNEEKILSLKKIKSKEVIGI